MQTLSTTEAANWCKERGVRLEQDLPADRVGFADARTRRFRIAIPDEATSAVALAYTVVMTGVTEYDEANFEGAMVWLKRWELWSESIDRAGYVYLDGVVEVSSDQPWLNSTPALVFSGGTFLRTHACLALPMLFQWDAYYVPVGAGFVAAVSHHGHLQMITRPESHDSLVQRFHDWTPEEL